MNCDAVSRCDPLDAQLGDPQGEHATDRDIAHKQEPGDVLGSDEGGLDKTSASSRSRQPH